MDTPSLQPGHGVGPYELVRPLGTGGSGEVWEALLCGPGGFRKPVALKMLKERTFADPTQQAMLLREARLGARLQHPNVVSTLLVSEHDGRVCVALELVRGCSAKELLEAVGPLPGRALLDLGEQAATALHHIHTFRHNGVAAGLIHRDVKPGNLMVDAYGVVKLADLGISLPLEETSFVAGTYGFMPPEQLSGEAEPRSDLFGLGATLYLLATGQRAFGGGREAFLAVMQADKRLARPEMLAPLDACVPGLAEIVQACLRQSATDRPPSAHAVAQALAALRADAPGLPLRALVAQAVPALGDTAMPEPPLSEASAPTRVLPGGNLKPVRDAFVGRQAELRLLKAKARQGSWLVLLGPGGMGKTRLALEVARSQQAVLPGGAWAFDLAEARTAAGLCGAIAGALGIPLGGQDPVAQIGHVFASKGHCLLVLDNLEQCVDALPETIDRWRAMAPEACLLGTSRIRPGLAGEDVVSIDVLQPADAARLFKARTQRVLSDDDRAHLPALCAALEHMPLPLELAAARVAVLSVKAIADRLSLDLLATRARDRPARQRSVQASLQWSWELLSAHGQSALGQLSVFGGSFTLSAAEAVLDLGDDAPWALDVLQELVDASLLRVDPHTLRFASWVVVREFGATLLGADARAGAELRHGEHYRRTDAAAAGLELDNLVAACQRAVARGDAEVACTTLEVASSVFHSRGPASAWTALAEEVGRMELTPPWRCRVLLQIGQAHLETGHTDRALAPLQQGIEEAQRIGARRTEARLRSQLGERFRRSGTRAKAKALFTEALAIHRAIGDVSGEALTQWRLGVLYGDRELDEARRHVLAAKQLDRSEGGDRWLAWIEASLGTIAARSGELEAARRHYERSFALAEGARDAQTAARVYGNLAALEALGGRYAEAEVQLERAVASHRRIGDPWNENNMLGNLAAVAMCQSKFDKARGCIERAISMGESIDDRRNLGFLHMVGGQTEWLSGHPAAARRHLEGGMAEATQDVVRPWSWEVHHILALLDLQEGSFASADVHLQQALDMATERKQGPAIADVRIARARAALHAPPRDAEALERARSELDTARQASALEGFTATRWWCVEAVLQRHLGDEAAVQRALAEAERHAAPERPQAQEALAWARRALGGG